MEKKFNAGDVVVLKSGGPKMTAGYTSQGTVNCVWFNTDQSLQTRDFYEETLDLANKEDKVVF
jgi:uncharacterized protein YodC (DUF2158 family)